MSDRQIRVDPPWALKAVNRIGAALQRCGLPLIRLDAKRILDKAQRATGHSLDASLAQTGLETLVRSLESEAELSLFGRFAMRNLLQRSVEARLNVEGALSTQSEATAQEIRAPVFIIGMPRSGTTILHALLHLDRNHRAPLAWECLLPYPAPRVEDYESGNERIATIQREFEQIFRLVPDFKKKHYMEVDSPQECIGITALNFVSYQFLAMTYVPTYDEWFRSADQVQNLRWHRAFLQFLQSGGVVSPRWLLKSPVHMMRLPAIFNVYPDAKVIATHRHPARVVPSTASLISSTRSFYSDHEDPRRTGREQLETWSDFLNRFLSDRQQVNKEEQIIDVQFESFNRNQMGVVDSIYERFGWELHPEDRERMEQFLRDEPRNKHGVHEYSLEDFDIRLEELTSRFTDYLEFLESAQHTSALPLGGSSHGE